MPRFNDDYYAVRITEWERERIPTVVSFGQWQWIGVIATVVIIVVGTVGDFSKWQHWLAVGSVGYVILKLFVFLHELNENVRFVRHKLEVLRVAHERVADQFRRYQQPNAVTVFDYVDSLDREWSE